MPFDANTKTSMFIKCGRLCCLCLKQCGTNIEAAHIIDESKGGSNDEDNGIPLCFDCHQEIGAYSSEHPKGNKFRPDELHARRNHIYTLVESGAIYAQVISQQWRELKSGAQLSKLPPIPTLEPSAEGKRFLALLLEQGERAIAPARKLNLLPASDKAYVIDSLLTECDNRNTAVQVLGILLTNKSLSTDRHRIILESIVRKITLFGELNVKVELLQCIPEDILNETPEDLRAALFEDLLAIVNQDQYDQVNILVPVLKEHIKDIPPDLYSEYVINFLKQSRSDAFKGAPAAAHALKHLPDEMVIKAFPRLDAEYLWLYGRTKQVKEFIERYKRLSTGKTEEMFNDLLLLSRKDFAEKYYSDDN
ncbi:MAG: HNH endonuclease [Desulfobulbaceae bacterium]